MDTTTLPNLSAEESKFEHWQYVHNGKNSYISYYQLE